MRAPNVFTISPALPFLDTFVAAFLRGEIVRTTTDGLGLADATIYVPTRRAARALGDLFLARATGGATILPRILPLGALEATEPALVLTEPDPVAAGLPLPPAASPLWRRLRLAALIQSWAHAVDGALRRIDAAGQHDVDRTEAFRVATSTADAFALAGDLADLIDEMRIEGIAWRALDDLRMAGFDDYWRITTTFLKIATEAWPQILADHGLVDPAQRQIDLADAQARALDGSDGMAPVIAIGSTGTNRATARLLGAIARAPNGAVILPGLDLDLDGAAWASIAGTLADGKEPSFGHSQAAMARLLPILRIAREDVRPLGAPSKPAKLRARLIAEALRPADTTDQWRAFRRAHGQKAVAEALAGVRVIEAADEREEALCLAVAMREALETPGRTAALVTPDRDLARRVRGELLRWDIEVDDTGGEALALRPLGVIARLLMNVAAGRMTAADIVALLAHPLATFGRPPEEMARLTRLLEIGFFSAPATANTSDEAAFRTAEKLAAELHAHPAQKAITRRDWSDMAIFWAHMRAALEPLTQLEGHQPLGVWIAAHRQVLAAVSDVAEADEALALDGLFSALSEDDAGTLRFSAADYDVFIGRLLREIVLRTTDRPHPRLQILGLLEARLLRADLVLLGGLDETIWPPQARSDAFLNRPMRHELGLTPPERRIGQTAHDFEQAMGNDTIVLTRALKRGGSPCVASRFLLRLEALCGGSWKAWDGCRQRGRETLALVRGLDQAASVVPVKRPRPAPPIALRPLALSVTQIETLRRDPYAIYASHILRLAPLPRAVDGFDPRQFGTALHDTLHRFCEGAAASGTPTARANALQDLLRKTFETSLADPDFATFRWPIVLKAAAVFLTFDSEQRKTVREIVTERSGRLDLTLADQTTFSLRARADRIDLHRDGTATLIDYKTGQVPGVNEVKVGFAPQLTLEAAILAGGGFAIPHHGATGATYVKLGGRDGGLVRPLEFDDATFEEIVARHVDGLVRLLSSLRNVETGYPSRPFPKYAKDYGDYDHLARVREWSLAGEDEATS